MAAPGSVTSAPLASGDGSGVNNLDILRPAYEWTPVANNKAPSPPAPGYFDFTWSLGTSGSASRDDTGTRFELGLSPNLTLTHTGARLNSSFGLNADITKQGGGQTTLAGLRLSTGADYTFNSLTSLSSHASLALTQEDANAPDVASDVAATPREISGAADTALTRKFGRASVTLRASVSRDVYGATTLTDGTKTQNTSQNLTQLGAGLRLGFALTPVLTAFADADTTRQRYDAADPTLGVKLDGLNSTLKAGLTANWGQMLTAEASVGLGLDHFDDGTTPNVRATLYNAAVTFRPDPTLTLVGDLSTTIGPTGPDEGGTAALAYAATGNATYIVNHWLDLRASAGWHRTEYQGTATTDRGYALGFGADYALSGHTRLSADYGFTHSTVTPNPAVNTQTVTLGVTVSG